MKIQRISKRKLYVTRDERGRFIKWKSKKELDSYEIRELKRNSLKDRQRIYWKKRSEKTSSKRTFKKYSYQKTEYDKVNMYELSRPIKGKTGYLWVEADFYKGNTCIKKGAVGRSARHSLPKDYDRAFKEAIGGASKQVGQSWDFYDVKGQRFVYYFPK